MGDYRRVVHPTNSKGQVCGRDVPGKPYLYFFDLAKCFTLAPSALFVGCPTPQVCVEQCPEYYWSWRSSVPSPHLMICLEGKDANAVEFKNMSVEELVRTHKCAPYIFNSKPVFGRCLPSQLAKMSTNQSIVASSGTEVALADDTNKAITGVSVIRGRNVILQLTGFIEKITADLQNSWPTILICLSLAVILSYVWILILRCCAGPMVWISILMFCLLFTVSTGFCFYRWYRLRKAEEVFPDELTLDFSLYLRSATLWLILGIISAIFLVIISLAVIFLRSRIVIAIRVMDEVSKGLVQMSTLLLWPLLPLILGALVFCLALFVAVSLRSISDPIGLESSGESVEQWRKDVRGFFKLIPCDPEADSSSGKACRFLYYGNRKYTIFLQFFNLFVFFWILSFIRALTETTLAGAFAQFFYSQHDPSVISKCPLFPSLFRAVFYHGGSLAFGSLILALLQWIRVLFEFLDAQMKQYDNACVRCLKGCCRCCMWCFERFIRFLNRNAFIMVAVHGTSFCSSASKAFGLIIRNVVRVIVVDKITTFVLFLGKLVIVLICGAFAYLYLDGLLFANTMLADYQPAVHYVGVPVALVVIGSFLITSLFFNVFDIGVDTIFLCFLEELERNENSSEPLYQTSSRLLKIVGKTDKSQLPE